MDSNSLKDYDLKMQEAISLLRSGKVDAAQIRLLGLAKKFPKSSEVRHYLAVVSITKKEFTEARTYYSDAINLEPFNANYHCNLGNVLQELGKIDESIGQFRLAINCDPSLSDAYYNLGNALSIKGSYKEALHNYEIALKQKPEWAIVYLNMGNAYKAIGNLELALCSFNSAIQVNPSEYSFYFERAKLNIGMNNFDAALNDCETGFGLKPSFTEFNFLAAEIFLIRGEETKIVPYLIQRFKTKDYFAYLVLGVMLREYGSIEKAILALETSYQINPDYAGTAGFLGKCYLQNSSYEKSVSFSRRALALDPLGMQIIVNEIKENLVQALEQSGNLRDALRENENMPLCHQSIGKSIFYRQMMYDWDGYEKRIEILKERVENLVDCSATEDPWCLYSVLDDPPALKEIAKRYIKKSIEPLLRQYRAVRYSVSTVEPICLGYFSPDFREHAVSHVTRKLFQLHSRKEFKVIGFSYGLNQANDRMYPRLKNVFDELIDISKFSDRDIQHIARKLKIDIAIDLAGLTGAVRPAIFAKRLAPIQVNYLGLAGTTGSPWHDYLIADSVAVPTDSFDAYSEKIVHLRQFMPYDTDIKNVPRVISRAEYGLPPHGFIFGCFNNQYKITPTVFDVWLQILKKVPSSILWIKDAPFEYKKRLFEYAEGRGVSPNRLIFAGHLDDINNHLQRYFLIDLFLDTHPYNGHCTTMDSLWMGTPVLSLTGKSFHARVAASLLSSVAMDDLIANDIHEYENKAVELALSPTKLAGVKSRLKKQHELKKVFPMADYVSDIEKAYKEMIDRCRNGLKPIHFKV